MSSCYVCNRRLKDPESVRRGIGPTCMKRQQAKVDNTRDFDEGSYSEYAGGDIIIRRDLNGLNFNFPRTMVKHSPTGLEIGYPGSGPADCALNIMLQFVPQHLALLVYQEFKWKFVAAMDSQGGTIKREAIIEFLEEKLGKKTVKEFVK